MPKPRIWITRRLSDATLERAERDYDTVVNHADTPGTADELIAFARERLAGYKRPRAITFLKPDEMPRNATGKILHRKLRDMLADLADFVVERVS